MSSSTGWSARRGTARSRRELAGGKARACGNRQEPGTNNRGDGGADTEQADRRRDHVGPRVRPAHCRRQCRRRAGRRRSQGERAVNRGDRGQPIAVDLVLRSDPRFARGLELVRFLQRQPWVDVIFTRAGKDDQGSVPGTLSFDMTKGSHPTRAPDVAATLAWTSSRNPFGVAGAQTVHSSKPGPIADGASGHGGLSPWVVRNTLVL